MFGAKPELSLTVDDVNKPIWTTGDVASGNIRLFTTSRISITDIKVALHCDEIAAVSQNANERVSAFKRKDVRRATKTVSKTISHFKFSQDVLAFDESIGPHVLEAGEYLFPFTLELTSEINQGPPSSVVIAENGVASGVKWYLKAVARRSNKLLRDVKVEQEIPVFPRDATRYLTVGPKTMMQQKELSGHKYISQKLSFWDKMSQKKKLTGASVEAILKFPGGGLPQKPQPPQFQLSIAANEAPALLNSIKIELLRKCEVTVKGTRDLYTTRHLIGAATVSRKLIGEQDFTTLVTGITLPQVFTPAFSTQMLNVYYELSLTIGFLPIVDDVMQQEDTLCIATPVELKPLPFERFSKTVTFQEVTVGLNDVQRSRRLQSAQSTAETHTSGTTGTSGTWAGVEIEGPTEYISSWLGSLTGH